MVIQLCVLNNDVCYKFPYFSQFKDLNGPQLDLMHTYTFPFNSFKKKSSRMVCNLVA